jgi:4-hydroxy-tetrahydrodipicolinate reductase
MISVMVVGASGRMGRTVCAAVAAEKGLSLDVAVDPAFGEREQAEAPELAGAACHASLEAGLEMGPDAAVDFTTPDSVFGNVMACLDRGVHCVVGTTGLSDEQLEEIERKATTGSANCFLAPNFAVGAVMLMEAARMVARQMPACEIIELHHDRKLDAPSGTALRTADLIAEARGDARHPPGPAGEPSRGRTHRGIPIHSVRLPGLVAHEEVVFGGLGQTLTIRHDSLSRQSFMPGVLLALHKVMKLDGMVVGLEKLF